MKKINVKIKGVAPLLQNRFPEEEHGENHVTGKKKVYNAKEEAEKALYRDKKTKEIVHPTEHIFGALIKAGTSFKFEGKKTFKDIIKAGVVIEPEYVSLHKKNWDEIDTRPVVIQRARVMKWRPRFNEWELEFEIQILDDENISIPLLKQILERAGTYHGIGDYRPRFGRFMVTNFAEVSE